MASKRIYVTLMVDINNDNLNEIDDNLVTDIVAEYTNSYECEECEVEAELCDWTEGD